MYTANELTVLDSIYINEWEIDDWEISTDSIDQNERYYDVEKSAIVCEITLRRHIQYYTKFVFVPSILLVFISYSSFYINHKAVPARTLLGVVPILTSLTTLAAHMSQMPKFSYTSWLIVFLFSNTMFNTITMFEYAFIAYIDWEYGDKKPQRKLETNPLSPPVMFAIDKEEDEEEGGDGNT